MPMSVFLDLDLHLYLDLFFYLCPYLSSIYSEIFIPHLLIAWTLSEVSLGVKQEPERQIPSPHGACLSVGKADDHPVAI